MSERIEQFFSQLSGQIEESRTLLKEGREIELERLEKGMGALFREAEALAQELNENYPDRFKALLDDLQVLIRELTERRQRVYEEIQGLTQHKRAGAAYRRADSTEKIPKDDDGHG